VTGNAATLDVVRADVAQWEGNRAVDVVAIAQERVNRDDLDPGIDRALQRGDHLFLVDRREDDVVQVTARDHRVQDGCLHGRTPARGILRHDDLHAEIRPSLVDAQLHHLVEGIEHAGQKADDRLVILGDHRHGGYQRNGQQQYESDHQ